MVIRRLAIIALAVALAAGSSLLADDSAKAQSKGHCVLNAFAKRLGLSDQQKEQMRKIHDEYDSKGQTLRHDLWKLRHEQKEAIKKVLTADQRNELPNVMKAEFDKGRSEIADKLNLTEDQRKQVKQIADEFHNKFRTLAQEAKTQGANVAGRFHALKTEEFEAMCRILTDDQRVKLPGVLKAEKEMWLSEKGQTSVRNDIADRLHLTADQRTQVGKVCGDFAPQIEKKRSELKQMWQNELSAVKNVLSDTQRAKFDALIKEGRSAAESKTE